MIVDWFTRRYFSARCQWHRRWPHVTCPVCDWMAWERDPVDRMRRLMAHSLKVHAGIDPANLAEHAGVDPR